MKKILLLVAAAVLVGAAALAQLRITSFNSSGELSWTNSIYRGFYSVESSESPAGPWNPMATVADMDVANTNRVTVQVPLTNTPAFYRVAWIPPDPDGVWDYRGYDRDGVLVITGRLSLVTGSLLGTNPVGHYQVLGSWDLGYAGPPTNALSLWWLGPQIGTGTLSGLFIMDKALLQLSWPTNVYDFNVFLSGDLWPNTYTGRWLYITWVGPQGGTFNALRASASYGISNQQQFLNRKGLRP